jgi:beta-lactamase regulating signal transducer with metallopeptidase domain/exonuclease VII small subunit
MTQTFIPYLTQLIQSIGWSLLHSLWQGALIWIILTVMFRAFPAMSARMKHGCSLMALMLLGFWVANTAITQWDQLQSVPVRVTSGYATTTGSYTIEVPPAGPGFAHVPESAWLQISGWMPWLMLAYCLGLLIMLGRFGASLAQLYNLRRRNTTVPEEQMLQLLQTLRLQMGIAQNVILRLSTRVAVPIVIGALRPLILLPASMVESLTPGELEAILLHELAHISRADFLINVLQSCLETLLFFNPFVWWMSASIRREREHCCDDLVVAYTRQPLIYARVLASLAQHQPAPSIALATTGQRPLLLNRIKRIIEMKNNPLRYGHIIAACSLAAMLLTVSIVCFTPSFAQKSKKTTTQKTAEEQTSSETRREERIVIIDSNGTRHEYGGFDELPPAQKAKLQATIKKGMKSAEEGQKRLDDVQKELVIMRHMNVDSVAGEAMKTAEMAMNGIDWDAISEEVDSAMHEVAVVAWPAIRREVKEGLSIARIRMADTQWKAEMRRGLAGAQRQMALANRNIKVVESQRIMEGAHREMEQAERRLEQARQEMAQAKADLRRIRRECSANPGSGERVAPPAPPSPPSSTGIPAPPAPPASRPAPVPSVAPPSPAAPPAGSYRK